MSILNNEQEDQIKEFLLESTDQAFLLGMNYKRLEILAKTSTMAITLGFSEKDTETILKQLGLMDADTADDLQKVLS